MRMTICFIAGFLIGVVFTIIVAVVLGGEGIDDEM